MLLSEIVEGAQIPLTALMFGNALRDPALFSENGRDYPIYAVAGEFGFAIGELV